MLYKLKDIILAFLRLFIRIFTKNTVSFMSKNFAQKWLFRNKAEMGYNLPLLFDYRVVDLLGNISLEYNVRG